MRVNTRPFTVFNPAAAALDALEFPVWMIDRELRLTTFNHAFAIFHQKVFGLLPLEGLTVAPDDKLLQQKFAEASKQPVKFSFSSGDSRWTISLKPVETGTDGLYITGNAVPETSHTNKGEHYEMVTLSCNDLLCLHQPDTTFTYVSPSINQLLGYTEKEVLGKSLFSFIHPGDIQRVKEPSLPEEGSLTLEYRMRRKDNSWAWVESSFTCIYDADGNFTSFQSATRNINERKLRISKLEDQHSILKDLISILPAHILIKDDQRRILFVSRSFAELLGKKEEDLLLHSMNEIDSMPMELYAFEASDNEVLSGNITLAKNEKITLPDGSTRWFYAVRKGHQLSDGTGRIIAVYSDITPVMEAEQKLMVVNEELKNFAYKVSHDLKAPISSILGIVSYASTVLHDQETHRYLGFIEDRTKKLNVLLDEFLKISSLTSGELTIRKINFSDLVDGINRELEYKTFFRGLHVSLNDNSTQPFMANFTLVNSIFQNLMENAAKYQKPEGNGRLNITIWNTGNRFTFSFEDDGIGIADEEKEKIFDMFYRASDSAEGSGLGLHLVKSAVEKMDGTVRMKSRGGKGTTFIVEVTSNTNKHEQQETDEG